MLKNKRKCSESSDDMPLAQKLKSSDNDPIIISESDDSFGYEFHESTIKKHVNSMNEWDEFCWKCHEPSQFEVRCSKCVLSFHMNCVRGVNRHKSDWKCPECEAVDKHRRSNLNDTDHGEWLKIALERIIRQQRNFDILMGDINEELKEKSLINRVTLSDIIKKTKERRYCNINAFVVDFKWLLHNNSVLYHLHKDIEDNERQSIAEELMKKCESEISELKNCGNCYANMENDNAFTAVCPQPHLLLWAKFKEFPFWPCKLLSVERGRNPLNVHFFQDHTTAKVPYDVCYLYSKEDPNLWITDRHQIGFKEAVNEASVHIRKIEKKFGSFHFAAKKITPNARKIDAYLDEMIPGYRNPVRLSNKSMNATGLDYVNDESTSMPESSANFRDIIPEIPIKNQTESVFDGNGSLPLGQGQFEPHIINTVREYISALKQEYTDNKAEIKQQSQKIAMLEMELLKRDNKYEALMAKHTKLIEEFRATKTFHESSGDSRKNGSIL